MSLPKTILVPTDFSDCADLALDRAIEFAKSFGAKLVVLYACPIPFVSPIDGAIVPNGEVVQALEEAGEKGLGLAIAKCKEAGVNARPVLHVGDPRVVILEVGHETKADLIIMGTHGRTGISHLFMGSTAEATVRTSPIPVLTVRVTAQRRAAEAMPATAR